MEEMNQGARDYGRGFRRLSTATVVVVAVNLGAWILGWLFLLGHPTWRPQFSGPAWGQEAFLGFTLIIIIGGVTIACIGAGWLLYKALRWLAGVIGGVRDDRL